MNRDEQKDQQWLQNLFKKSGGGKKKKLPLHYILLLGCVGLALMITGNLLTNPAGDEEQSLPVFNEEQEDDEPVFKRSSSVEPNSMQDYEMRYENQLKEILEQMVGISDVSVMVNLAETERNVYERNVNEKQQNTDETDREGGTRKVEDLSRDEQIVITRNGDKEVPILVQTEKPTIRGVLVVAKGVENAQVKSWVIEAVSRGLDVPTHRVSVMPKKTKEDL
ncbi:stage III sporulation protein AG [Halalkalibacter akibai]|uniref:Stage III sporulation protein AG n=1 Tax=Halalkalibacter akibai (strain ATCC 43226 / DSM 21942 / CIP 109018 / JCM 9157 / 1139) TaxID=1236973 RepID=W4QWQ4_HALA3|nr:stage III sporulation protein AG [Halalkalibacter akibai]GAE36337.1 stage III sporulation protein AG [Halalkalibacter akibai JCM 9157]